MSFFAKQGGDGFNIQDSQSNNENNNSKKSSQKDLYTGIGGGATPNNLQDKKGLRRQSSIEKQSILNKAGQNILGSGTPQNQKKSNNNNNQNQIISDKEKEEANLKAASDMIDDKLANKLVSRLYQEGGVANNMFQNKPPRFQPSLNPKQPNLSSQQSGKNLTPKRKSAGVASGKDSDILATMAGRLSKLEMTCNNQRHEIKDQAFKIQSLEKEVQQYKKSDEKNFKIEYAKLETENADLKSQLNEMEIFLNQYGLKWKGYSKEGKQKNEEEVKKLKDQLSALTDHKYKYTLPKEIDINIMIRRIEDLNYVMEKEGVNQVIKDKQGIHQFKKMEPFPIGFYQNGLVLKGFPFFPYAGNESMHILQDIFDGYFPYQLKKEFPNGTLLRIIDKTDQPYNPEKIMPKFGDMSGNNDNDNDLKPISKEEFLAKLPKNVIKNGKVVDIRDEIAKKFEVNNEVQSKENIEKAKQKENRAKKFEHRMEDDRTYIPVTEEQKQFDSNSLSQGMKDEICELKVRTETGKYIILIKLFAEKKVQDLVNIVKHFSELEDFDIMDNSTRQLVNIKENNTLMELDFHPTAVLTLKQKNQ